KGAGRTSPLDYFVLLGALAGALLEDWGAEQREELGGRGKGHPDHARLAKAWVRAVSACEEGFERTGCYLFDRKHGYRTATARVPSKVCAPFVQHLVEIDKLVAGMSGRSLDLKFERAAQEVIAEWRRTAERQIRDTD